MLSQFGTNVASGGTVTPTGITWTDTYEPDVKLALSVHASAAGALVATLEQSNVVRSGYTTLGTIEAGTVAGVYTLNAFATQQFLRVTATATGGTTPATALLYGVKRTVI